MKGFKESVQDRLDFVGEDSYECLPYLYSGADIFVSPSLYERFGLPPLEAMTYGISVVTSNAS